MGDFSGKNFLIIGGSSGIGLKLSRELIDKGAGIEVWSRSRPEELSELNLKHTVVDITSDIGDVQFSENLDGLVYCPGTISLGQFKRLTLEQFRTDFEVNFLGAVRVIQHVEKALKKGNGASIVLFSTVAVQTGMMFHTSIAAAKGAVEGFVRSLAAEYAPAHIRVNAIAPSITDTPLSAKMLERDKQRQASAERHPLGRIGDTSDMASGAMFLLSSDSDWITGQILHIDGGISALR